MSTSGLLRPLVRLAFVLGILLFFGGGLYSAYLFYSTIRELTAPPRLPEEAWQAPPAAERAEEPEPPVGERINVLVLGLDRRPYERGPSRTDTVLLLSLDPAARSAAMLSIPRDLWVHIPYPEPGFENRINTAHFYGEVDAYPEGGGPGLAMRTVEVNLGIPVRHYVRLNFDGFRRMVDLVGGVEIEVEREILDARYPTDDDRPMTIHIPSGRVNMDGETALRYVRTRATPGADLDRLQRQQQVVLALRERVLSLRMLPRLPQLLAVMPEVVDTNLSPAQVLTLARLASQVPEERIQRVAIDGTMVKPVIMPDGAQVLLPCRELIEGCQATLQDAVLAFVSPALAPAAPQEPDREEPGQERARILVENGTERPGLAEGAFDYLRARGLEAVGFGSAESFDHPETLIIDYTGNPATVRRLQELLGLTPERVRIGEGGPPGIDIRLVLGRDFAPPEPLAGR